MGGVLRRGAIGTDGAEFDVAVNEKKVLLLDERPLESDPLLLGQIAEKGFEAIFRIFVLIELIFLDLPLSLPHRFRLARLVAFN